MESFEIEHVNHETGCGICRAEVVLGALASSIEAPVHKNGIWKELFCCIACILSFMHPDVGYGKKVRYNLAFS